MFDSFLSWWASRTIRVKGSPPSAGTLRSKGSRLNALAAHLGVATPEALATICTDREQLEGLFDKLYARLEPGSVKNDVLALRQFAEYAVAKGWIESHAIRREDAPTNIPQKSVTIYTDEEVERILRFAESRDLRFWCFLVTVADTGRRVGEVLGLEWEWLNLNADPAYFDLPYSKNERQQFVPLSTRLRTEVFTERNIERLKTAESGRIKRDPAVYPFPWHYQTVAARLDHLCDLADIPQKGFHCFRHTRATRWLEKGVPLQAVSVLLGHANTATTDRIYHHATALGYAQYLD